MKAASFTILAAFALLLAPGAHAAPTPAQQCEAAVELAAAKHAQCLLNAESKYSKALDAAKRTAALAKCATKLGAAFTRAVTRWGAASCTGATSTQYDAYLSQCSDEAAAAAAPGATLPACGNAAIDVPGEQCDGSDLGGQTCSSLGFPGGGTLGCTAGCELDTAACAPSSCGNGAVDGAEQCDGGDLGGATCAGLGYTLGGTLACGAGCAFDIGGCASQALPATGQTACWSAAGTSIACAGTGQDGEVLAGGPLAYVDHGDGTITDVNTGLMWEKLGDDGSIHDKDDEYSWSDAFSVKLAALNAGSGFAGYTDWRIPNVKELHGLVDYGVAIGALPIPPAFDTGCVPGCSVTACSCARGSDHWTSTTYVLIRSEAYYVFFSAGSVSAFPKTTLNHVRAVRGGL